MTTVYVVERHWDYEGGDSLFATADRDQALSLADDIEHGDRVLVIAFAPHPVEILTRVGWNDRLDRPSTLTYERRILADGEWIDQESEVREVTS